MLVGSVQVMFEAGRIRPAAAPAVARRFLGATHGHVLLRIAGGPDEEEAAAVLSGALPVPVTEPGGG